MWVACGKAAARHARPQWLALLSSRQPPSGAESATHAAAVSCSSEGTEQILKALWCFLDDAHALRPSLRQQCAPLCLWSARAHAVRMCPVQSVTVRRAAAAYAVACERYFVASHLISLPI